MEPSNPELKRPDMINSLVTLTVLALSGCAPEKAPPCGKGEFAVVEEDAPDVITCLNLTVCSETEYETQAPTYSSDRQCEPITSCAP